MQSSQEIISNFLLLLWLYFDVIVIEVVVADVAVSAEYVVS